MKVPCSKCGAAILTSTADKNGGLCVPCRKGTRESLERAKRWYKEQRERERTDPFWKLWQTLVTRVDKAESGLSALSDVEKQYFAVGLLDGEVYNGGFDQYFHNSSGGTYRWAVLGLEAMEAKRSLELLQRAKQVLFDFDDVPEDTSARRSYLAHKQSPSRSKRLEGLDDEYWKDPDTLAKRSEAFARKHGFV
jgi:hypothetical protein